MGNMLNGPDAAKNAFFKEVMKKAVQSLDEDDLVDSIPVGGKTWNIYKYTHKESELLIACRQVNNELEIEAVCRTMPEIEEVLTT